MFWFRKLLRDIPAKILVQLCASLLLLNLLFLLDSWLARYPSRSLCISTAWFLHYFLLTSFTWAGLEALHMYLSVVKVFLPYLSRYMLKVSLIGWGEERPEVLERCRAAPLMSLPGLCRTSSSCGRCHGIGGQRQLRSGFVFQSCRWNV